MGERVTPIVCIRHRDVLMHLVELMFLHKGNEGGLYNLKIDAVEPQELMTS
jgi:hypothetical protein